MIVSPQFDGDINKMLQDAQHDSYGSNVWLIFEACSKKLIEASDLLQLNTETSNQLRGIKAFDHRVLQDTHDIIAAYYRYKFGSPQLSIFGGVKTKDEYAFDWAGWLRGEIIELSSFPPFVRAVANAVIFSNTASGYAAENEAARQLLAKYQAGDWGRPDGYLKSY